MKSIDLHIWQHAIWTFLQTTLIFIQFMYEPFCICLDIAVIIMENSLLKLWLVGWRTYSVSCSGCSDRPGLSRFLELWVFKTLQSCPNTPGLINWISYFDLITYPSHVRKFGDQFHSCLECLPTNLWLICRLLHKYKEVKNSACCHVKPVLFECAHWGLYSVRTSGTVIWIFGA